MTSPAETLNQTFLAIRDELDRMRELAAGDDGADLATLPAEDGLLNDTIRSIAEGVQDLLIWLHGASQNAAGYVSEADALLATIELARDIVVAFGEVLAETDLSPLGDMVGKPDLLDGAESALGSAGSALQNIPELPDLLPDPSTLRAIATSIEGLVGSQVGATTEPVLGAYGARIEAIPSSTS